MHQVFFVLTTIVLKLIAGMNAKNMQAIAFVFLLKPLQQHVTKV
jgi:hypothetical protein